MIWKVKKTQLSGVLAVPPSKSHTIRALLFATLAHGKSVIEGALLEGDGHSALNAARGLGAVTEINGDTLTLTGIAGELSGGIDFLDLGNSGTGTRLFSSAAALGSRERTFDGDASLRTRLMRPLLESLKDLGATYRIHASGGDIPFSICGPLRGGETTVPGITSQFLSSLLCTCPLLAQDSCIHVTDLHERPYVELTLWWLDKLGISYRIADNFTTFHIPGRQSYRPLCMRIPGDFSSATFGAVAAALTGGPVTLSNIDFTDPQGDKHVFTLLEQMGVQVTRRAFSATVAAKNTLHGTTIDLNTMPDALPALSVLGCFAQGTTALVNVEQARIKETDRIAVMAGELARMGARIEERADGLVVHHSSLKGCRVSGHHDHRVVMALALAGMIAEGETIIETAEAAAVTYPGFAQDFRNIGASIKIAE